MNNKKGVSINENKHAAKTLFIHKIWEPWALPRVRFGVIISMITHTVYEYTSHTHYPPTLYTCAHTTRHTHTPRTQVTNNTTPHTHTQAVVPYLLPVAVLSEGMLWEFRQRLDGPLVAAAVEAAEDAQ